MVKQVKSESSNPKKRSDTPRQSRKSRRKKAEPEKRPGARRLVGMLAIAGYMDRSEATMMRYIQVRAFPATKVGGVWESRSDWVDVWRRMQGEDVNVDAVDAKMNELMGARQ